MIQKSVNKPFVIQYLDKDITDNIDFKVTATDI